MKKYIFLVIFSLFSITNGYAEMWDSQTLTAIDKADDLKIAPNRANGIHGTPTWIWEVVVEGKLYVRAYSGQSSSWYKSAIAYKKGIIQAAGAEYQVSFEPVNDPALNDKIDAAYLAKYKGSPYVRHMVSQSCRNATVEIIRSEK